MIPDEPWFGTGWRSATREPFLAWPPPGHVPVEGVIRTPVVPAPWGAWGGNLLTDMDWTIRFPHPLDRLDVDVRLRGRHLPIERVAKTGYQGMWRFRPVFAPSDLVGDTTFEVTAQGDDDGSVTTYSYRVTFIEPREVTRHAGADRFATAAAVVLEDRRPRAVETVYVATGESFPDGLAAGGPGGPVLLTNRTRLPEPTRHAIEALAPAEVVLLGGDAAISPAVDAELGRLAPTRRVAGDDRYDTAARLALREWPSGADTVYVVTGAAYPDALAAGAADAPILLTHGTGLHPSAEAAIDVLRPRRIVVVGGSAAVSDAVEVQLASHAPTERVFGADRYETAALLAQRLGTTGDVYLASGTGFADALAAGGSDRPVLLSAPGQIPGATRSALRALSPDRIIVVGGTNAVSASVGTDLMAFER